MSFDSGKRDALIAEGLTEAEADYLVSEGRQTEGLTPPPGSSYVPEPAERSGSNSSDYSTQSQPSHSNDQQSHQSQSYDGERAQRDQERRELQELRDRNARLDERMRIFNEAVNSGQQQQQYQGPPDAESDPFGYMKWQSERINALEHVNREVVSHVQEREASQNLHNAYVSDARQFAQRTPDFAQAYHWLMNNRDAELAAAGYRDPNERARIIHADERDIVARALHSRQSPSAVVYGLAKARGFAGGGQAAQGQRGGSQRGAGSQQGGFDLERIANLSDSQYIAWKNALSPQQRRNFNRALGGS
jgi:hypothetical protein